MDDSLTLNIIIFTKNFSQVLFSLTQQQLRKRFLSLASYHLAIQLNVFVDSNSGKKTWKVQKHYMFLLIMN